MAESIGGKRLGEALKTAINWVETVDDSLLRTLLEEGHPESQSARNTLGERIRNLGSMTHLLPSPGGLWKKDLMRVLPPLQGLPASGFSEGFTSLNAGRYCKKPASIRKTDSLIPYKIADLIADQRLWAKTAHQTLSQAFGWEGEAETPIELGAQRMLDISFHLDSYLRAYPGQLSAIQSRFNFADGAWEKMWGFASANGGYGELLKAEVETIRRKYGEEINATR